MPRIYKMKFLALADVEQIINNSPPGRNTKFLSSAHSLWTRFKNYGSNPPMALEVNGQVVSIIFATFNRDRYTNLYEIVTIQGKEGNGYASKIWDAYIDYAVNAKHSSRLKISCTPESVTWHMKNGLIFWAIDPTGSLRSDQPLFKTREEQLSFRNLAVKDPSMALPTDKVCEKLRKESLESHNFGSKKKQKTEEAIQKVGEYWLREALFDYARLFD